MQIIIKMVIATTATLPAAATYMSEKKSQKKINQPHYFSEKVIPYA